MFVLVVRVLLGLSWKNKQRKHHAFLCQKVCSNSIQQTSLGEMNDSFINNKSKISMRKSFFLLFALLMVLPSCMSTRTSVANYQMTDGEEMCYSKGRQCYLFWGLVPLGRTRVATPPDGVCEVRTHYGFWDAFVSIITGGIFEMQQIRVYTKKPAKATTPATSPSSPTSDSSTTPSQP